MMASGDNFVVQEELVKKLRSLADEIEADRDFVRLNLQIDGSNPDTQRVDASFSSPNFLSVRFSYHRPTPKGWKPPTAEFQKTVK